MTLELAHSLALVAAAFEGSCARLAAFSGTSRLSDHPPVLLAGLNK